MDGLRTWSSALFVTRSGYWAGVLRSRRRSASSGDAAKSHRAPDVMAAPRLGVVSLTVEGGIERVSRNARLQTRGSSPEFERGCLVEAVHPLGSSPRYHFDRPE
jgi:hypothetical protein